MTQFRYPLATPSWDEKEINAMHRIIDSGFFTMGKETNKFENEFANYLGVKYCVMVNSGSSANLLMAAALFFCKKLNIKPDDEIIVPAVSWSTTFYPFSQYGLVLKFVDVNKDTYNIDCKSIIDSITTKTKIICAVNIYGNPCDFDLLREICEKNRIILLEDNCESLGAKYNGKLTGTFGLMSTFSFFFSHHISTMEGGMIATDDEELYHIMLSLRAHGWTRNLPSVNYVTGIKDENEFHESFKFVLPGYNLRPLELSAAVGIEQLIKLPSFILDRRKNAEYFINKMKDTNVIKAQVEVGYSSWFGFGVIVNPSLNRDTIVNKLQSAGIECRPISAGNFTKNPVIKFIKHEISSNLTNSDLVDKNGLLLGNSHLDLSQEIDHLFLTLNS